MDPTVRELELLMRSRHPLIAMDSQEEERVLEIVHRAAAAIGMPMVTWSVTRGLTRNGLAVSPGDTSHPLTGLKCAVSYGQRAAFFFKDLTSWLDDPKLVRQLRDIASHFSSDESAVLFLARPEALPETLRCVTAPFRIALPGPDELKKLAWRVLQDFGQGTRSVTMNLPGATLERMIQSLGGLTLGQAERALRRAVADDLTLDASDLGGIHEARRQVLHDQSALEYVDAREGLEDVGGLQGLKAWLAKRDRAYSEEAKAFGLPPPKGLVLLGVQGCGKSLAARAVAAAWGLPLLKLESGRLYDKYIGESDKNIDRALRTAERLAPCVLWIDEIEKAFAFQGGSQEADGGLSQRIMGRLLGWLQDRAEPVFVVATCNDVQGLPPELLRKGRFDEIFFVDLPTLGERAEILALHLRRRGRDPANFDLPALAARAEGFSGAELEQVVVAGLYAAFAGETTLSDAILGSEISATRPLSVTRAESIQALRTWAQGRAVPAGRSGA